jgi:hypothetical protein
MASANSVAQGMPRETSDLERLSQDGLPVSIKSEAISWKNLLNLAAYVLNTVVTYSSLTGIFGSTNTELSNKYQTLVTPAGWAFSIWGPIFIWEGVFVVVQFFPRFRQSSLVLKVSPWWWALCLAQISWTLAFAQEQITLALVFMLSILTTLLGISWSTDAMQMDVVEYLLLRAPFSLQLGWIIAASAVNANVQADAAKASQEVLLAFAVGSNAVVLAIVSAFTFAVRSPDPFVGFVAAWAFAGIYSALSDPTKLNDPDRFNPSKWDAVALGGLKFAALGISALAFMLAVFATIKKIYRHYQNSGEDRSVKN